jgi:hypothetical protein
LVVEHLPLDHVPDVRARIEELVTHDLLEVGDAATS